MPGTYTFQASITEEYEQEQAKMAAYQIDASRKRDALRRKHRSEKIDKEEVNVMVQEAIESSKRRTKTGDKAMTAWDCV